MLKPVRLLAAVVLLLGALTGAAAGSTTDAPTFPSPTPGMPWFGPQLDWLEDSADDYEERLGSSAALYGQRVAYPLDPDATYFLERLVTQSATQGAVPVLSLEPQVPLDELSVEDAEALAEALSGLSDELGTRYLLRFAPEMNGTWYAWGQQPTAYVAAFRAAPWSMVSSSRRQELALGGAAAVVLGVGAAVIGLTARRRQR